MQKTTLIIFSVCVAATLAISAISTKIIKRHDPDPEE